MNKGKAAQEEPLREVPHNIIMENRNSLTVSGISDVDSFDEQTVVLITSMGELTVKGEELHMNNLNLEMGEISLSGSIDSLTYYSEKQAQGGLWSRVFR